MNEAVKVEFVRSGISGGGVVQVWRSDVTRRQYEVSETDSYATATQLTPGDIGYLSFLEGTPVVTEQPLSRAQRLERLGRLRSRPRSPPADPRPRESGGNRMLLLVVGILVLVVLWALL